MARIESLAVISTNTGMDYLAEEYGKVIDNVQKNTISARLKNTDLSGNPTAGSVEAKRFVNRKSNPYGTARAGGAGQKVKAEPVTIQINVDRELITEVEEKDVSLYGVDNFINRQATLDEKSMTRELERKFFETAAAAGAGNSFTTSETAINKKIEALIQAVERTKNDYVDGVERDMIAVVLNTETYGELRDYLDTTDNANVTTAAGEFGTFHGVPVYSTVYLPDGVNGIAMIMGAVAQPVLTTLDEAGKFDASNAYHFGMFYSFGCKAVMPDLIQVLTATASGLTVVSAAGGTSGKTKLTVTPDAYSNDTLAYKTDTTVTLPTFGSASTGYTDWDGKSEITATTNNEIVVVELNADKKIVKAGKTKVTSK